MSQINLFLQKSFGSGNRKLDLGEISYHLTKCAKSGTYIETLGKHADSLHKWIKDSYEEDFKAAFQKQVKKALKHLKIRRAKLAFDITHEPFYGKKRNFFIFDTPMDKKYNGEFRYLVVSLINCKKQIPLMAIPVKIGDYQARLVIGLLKYCSTLFKEIKLALFDRGFYIAELIDYLQAKRINYIILVPEKQGIITDYVNQTNELKRFWHQMKFSRDKSTWKPKTFIVICKGIDDFAWIFATNLKFRTRVEYI